MSANREKAEGIALTLMQHVEEKGFRLMKPGRRSVGTHYGAKLRFGKTTSMSAGVDVLLDYIGIVVVPGLSYLDIDLLRIAQSGSGTRESHLKGMAFVGNILHRMAPSWRDGDNVIVDESTDAEGLSRRLCICFDEAYRLVDLFRQDLPTMLIMLEDESIWPRLCMTIDQRQQARVACLVTLKRPYADVAAVIEEWRQLARAHGLGPTALNWAIPHFEAAILTEYYPGEAPQSPRG